MADPQGEFGLSKYVADLHAPVPPDELRPAIEKLCGYLGVTDASLVDWFTSRGLVRLQFDKLQTWNERCAPHPVADATGRAARLFWAAQTVVEVLLLEDAIDQNAQFHPLVLTMLNAGAAGLLTVGIKQFDGLAKFTAQLISWLRRNRYRRLVLVESPLGNSLPVRLVERALQERGFNVAIELWNCPRNDKEFVGTTVNGSAKLFAKAVRNYDLIIYMDDSITSTRIRKTYDGLAKHCGANRVLGLAMHVHDLRTTTKDTIITPQRESLVKHFTKKQKHFKCNLVNSVFPLVEVFQTDGKGPVHWESPVMWGESELIAGKRKQNVIFSDIDTLADFLKLLGTPGNDLLPKLEMVLSTDTTGRTQGFANGLLAELFTNAATQLDLPQFKRALHLKARAAFPDDYMGNITSLNQADREDRWKCIKTSFIDEAIVRLTPHKPLEEDDQFPTREAWALWAILEIAFAAALPPGRGKLSRDSDYSPYTFKYNATILEFHERIAEFLLDRVRFWESEESKGGE